MRLFIPVLVSLSIFLNDASVYAQKNMIESPLESSQEIIINNPVVIPKAGEKIIAIQEAELKSGKDELGKVPAGAILQIKVVNGEWYWVPYEEKNGWVHNSKVLPLSQGFEHFTNVIQENPGLSNYIYRSNILIDMQKYAEAKNDCNMALTYDANNQIALSNRAYCNMSLKDFDAALTDVKKVIEGYPADTNAINLAGMIQLNRQDYQSAEKYFSKAVELNPKFVNAYLNLSISHSMQKQFDIALTDLNKMLEVSPESEMGLNYRGVAYFQLGKYDEAIQDFNKVISLNATNDGALVNRASALNEKQQYEKALLDIDAALKINANNPAAYNNRGYALQQLKKYTDAITAYNMAIQLAPGFATPWRNLADLYTNAENEEVKNLDKALEAGKKSCELSGNKDWKSLRNLALVYAAKNDYSHAVDSMKSAVVEAPVYQQESLKKLVSELEGKVTK